MNAPHEERIVDDRVFLRGLDQMYRDAVMLHERGELLRAARAVAEKLGVRPADVAAEGYYAKDEKLTEYFRLLHALQHEPKSRTAEVESMKEFRRVLAVTSSPLNGAPSNRDERLLPTGRDPLTIVLNLEGDWSLHRIIDLAHREASENDDCSLVALACLTHDAVLLTALRESVVLYGERAHFLPPHPEPMSNYVWRVSPEIARRGARFVSLFNALFGEELPEPVAENAAEFYEPGKSWNPSGRCVCIGQTGSDPVKYYHWAIVSNADGSFSVEEFWDEELWSTGQYRAKHTQDWRIHLGITTPPLIDQFR
jgi:hypothetical protein